MPKLLSLRLFHAAGLFALLVPAAGTALGEEALFDPTAARMMRMSVELSGEHGHSPSRERVAHERTSEREPTAEHAVPPPVLKHLPDPTPTPSLARPTEQLAPEEQRHFGPLAAGRHYDPRMIEAARIARHRAEPHMTWYCWRYVKDALVEAGVVGTRPASALAKQAGRELCDKYGFVKLHISDPMAAPVGAVIVYGGRDAGHVELRTESGFVSDFVSRTPYNRPMLGVYVKPT